MPTCIHLLQWIKDSQTTQTQLTTLDIHGEMSCTWQDACARWILFWLSLPNTNNGLRCSGPRKWRTENTTYASLPEMNTWATDSDLSYRIHSHPGSGWYTFRLYDSHHFSKTIPSSSCHSDTERNIRNQTITFHSSFQIENIWPFQKTWLATHKT